jgi:hypothetical protein
MTALKLNHKNVPVGSFRNRDEETNKMTRDVINNITLVCHDDMLIKAHTQFLRETNKFFKWSTTLIFFEIKKTSTFM